MHLWRGNSYGEIHCAPEWFLRNLARHLSVEVELGARPDDRYSRIYPHEGKFYGSLLRGNRFPAGLTATVLSLVADYERQGYALQLGVTDRRTRPAPCEPWGLVRERFRPYQDEVHAALLASDGTGVVDVPPRDGKTLMLARLIDHHALPVLYLAPTKAIVGQTYERFVRYFGADRVSRFDGDASHEMRSLARPVVLSTTASALKFPQAFFGTRHMLVLDEAHHGASNSLHQINARCEHVFYRYSCTGTYWRTGEDDLAMRAMCGEVLYKIGVQDLVPQYLTTPHIEFLPFTDRAVPARDWQKAYQLGIVECERRNNLIADFAYRLGEAGHSTIVLASRREHAKKLAEMIPRAQVVMGGAGDLTGKVVKSFCAGAFPVLVGTSVLGEGVDVPRASALVYAAGFGDSVQMMQSYFRPLTGAAHKPMGYVYDFTDDHHPTLQRQAVSRRKLAAQYLGPYVR